jgi:hypothetical protein
VRGVAEQTQRRGATPSLTLSLSLTHSRRPICPPRSGTPRFPNPINHFLNLLFSFRFLRPSLFPGKTYDLVSLLCVLCFCFFFFSFGPFVSLENGFLGFFICFAGLMIFSWKKSEQNFVSRSPSLIFGDG